MLLGYPLSKLSAIKMLMLPEDSLSKSILHQSHISNTFYDIELLIFLTPCDLNLHIAKNTIWRKAMAVQPNKR